MDSLIQDIRYAFRMLAKSPGFTLLAVLTLAIGIGANTTIFSWVNAVLLTPFPGVQRPGEIVDVQGRTANNAGFSLSYPDYVDYRDRNRTLAGLIAFDMVPMGLSHSGQAERVWGLAVTGNYFDVLGVRPLLGRTFLPEEDKTPGSHPVVVISEGLWQRRFGGDPNAIGRQVTINNNTFTVIGVTPGEFQGSYVGLNFDAYVPMMMQPQVMPGGSRLEQRGNHWMDALARVKPGISLEQADADLNAISLQLAKEYPQHNEGVSIKLYPMWKSPEGATSILGPVLLSLMALVGLVLLIACANVANLLLVRATGRRREIAVRLSLGASRIRLLRQLLTESVLLSLAAGGVAALVAIWSSGLFYTFVPPTHFPVRIQIALDERVLGFSLLISFLTALLFGAAPALQASRVELVTALKDESATVASGGRKARLRNALVVGQIALSLLLLICAGLLVRSLRSAQAFQPGFNPKNVLLASLDLFPSGYNAKTGTQFQTRLLERLSALPGVESATMARRVPLGIGGGSSSSNIEVEGYAPAKDEAVWSFFAWSGPDYFRTMQMQLLAGRDFRQSDNPEAPRVAIINESLAKRYWSDRDPVGQRVRIGEAWMTIVGVARDVKWRELTEAPRPTLFLPMLQFYRGDFVLHLRTSQEPASVAAAVRSVVHELDAELPVFAVTTLEDHVSGSYFQQQMMGTLLAAFGVLALVLAAVGIYGVLAYSVSQRTHEIGLRMALGAGRGDILKMVLRQGTLVAGIGIFVGCVAAAGSTRLLRKMLFGVDALDPLSFGAAALALAAVALFACYLPARRATTVDPMIALRYE